LSFATREEGISQIAHLPVVDLQAGAQKTVREVL